jgi:alpha-tubulin suppressor-like RCC1 family protein
MASGVFFLSVESALPEYLPLSRSMILARGVPDTVRDTLRPVFTGIPTVADLRFSQDTLAGVVLISWRKTTYRHFHDYVLYRDSCTSLEFAGSFFCSTHDTFYFDSLGRSWSADPADTAPRCFTYRAAVRSTLQATGPAYGSIRALLAPKSRVSTFFMHRVRCPTRTSDSASVDDTITVSVTAKNMARGLRALLWYDPVGGDTLRQASPRDSPATVISDTIRRSYHDIGPKRIIAVAYDNGGTAWKDTIAVTIVKDTPVADAGGDKVIWAGDRCRLHGTAIQNFGRIARWKWKIGSGDWTVTSGSDTVIAAPGEEQVLVCSLAVIDEDGDCGTDAMRLYVSTKVKAVAAGGASSFFLKSDGALWACGNNDSGQLGDGTRRCRPLPVQVMTGVAGVAAGTFHTLILTADGSLWTCGDNSRGQLGDGTQGSRALPLRCMTGVAGAAAGDFHSLILKADGSLWACGDNSYGQLGDGTDESRPLPVRIMDNVRGISAGARHTLILAADGGLWACGRNDHGQLGDGTQSDRSLPVKIMTDVKDMAAGGFHGLAVTTDGALWAFGYNYYGQLGDGTTIDRTAPVRILSSVRCVAAGDYHSLAVKSNGVLWVRGDNEFSQIPDRTMFDVRAVAAGDNHTLILKNDGYVWACGKNDYGQLGNNKQLETSGKLTQMIVDIESVMAAVDSTGSAQ